MGLFFIVIMSVLYFSATAFAEYSKEVVPIINAMRFITSLAVLLVYLPMAVRSFTKTKMEGADYLITGIAFTWLSALLLAASNEASRILQTGSFFLSVPIVGFFGMIMVMGGVFHITAPGYVSKWSVILSFVCAVVSYFLFRITLTMV